MKPGWWSCVMTLLCLPAWGEPSSGPAVSQHPRSTATVAVNSSFVIGCSTALAAPLGLSLSRGLQAPRPLLYLDLRAGAIGKETVAEAFRGRLAAAVERRASPGLSVRVTLSLLRRRDTDFYFCSWTHMPELELETRSSEGTVIIVKEEPKDCATNLWDFTLKILSATAFTSVLLIAAGALILRCRRQFKTDFSPATRAVKSPRSNRPLHVCPHRRTQPSPYLETADNTLDFSRIL